MEQEIIDKLRRIYKETTNEVAREGAKKKLQDAGIPLTAEATSSEPKKKTEPKATKPKSEPRAKAEPKAEPKSSSKSDNDTYCDELIAEAKKRKAKAKANAQKRANAPKKSPSTKTKEAVEKTATRVEKSVETRAKKGEVKVEELEKLIAEYQDAIKKLQALLSKVKSGKKFAKGGKMGMMDSEHANEYHKIKDHHCGCGDKMAKGGNAGEWSASDMTNAEYLGIVEIKDNDGEYHNFELMETNDRLIFGGSTNSGFIESGYIEKDGVSTDEAIQELHEELETYYNDGGEYTSILVFNDRMARGGGVKARTTVEVDRHYSALKEGKRVSRKYANVEIRGGGVYHRRNANQHGKVKGGKTYYEHHENRVDKARYLAEGGQIGKELMGGQPNQKKPSGAILLEVRKRGKEIVITEDGGKTKELYVKSYGFTGNTLHYNGNQYEFVHSL